MCVAETGSMSEVPQAAPPHDAPPQRGGNVGSQQRRGLFNVLPPLGWALLVLTIGLVLTATIAHHEWRDSQARAHAMHASLADAARGRVRDPLEGAAVALRAMQTVFLAQGEMSQAAFAHYQENLRAVGNLPGYIVTAFARRIELPDGRQHYRYELISPMDGNEELLWFDLTTQPDNLAALEQARDSDLLSMSAPFPLLQVGEAGLGGRGITLRLPVYSRGPAPVTVEERRTREIGALAISLQLDPLVRIGLQGRILEFMHVAIHDPDASGDGRVFASGPEPAHDVSALVRELEFGGRRWELRLRPHSARAETHKVVSLIAVGSLISLLLSLLLWSIASTHRRALAMSQRMGARFAESETRFRTLNELLPALVVLADGEDNITYANQFARQRLGEVTGRPLASVFGDRMLADELAADPEGHSSWEDREVELLAPGGGFWASISLAPVVVDGQRHRLLAASDISEQRELAARLGYQATHDALTELWNRREFERRLARALERQRLDPVGSRFALLYFDLDQFKVVNDLSGHRAGDQLLVELVMALSREMREGDLIARLGGDEFGLLAYGVDAGEAMALAERLRRCIDSVRFIWKGRTHSVSASIGVVMLDRPGATLQDVMAWADSACYLAKENGRNRVHLYREDDDTTRRHGEMEWANRLASALEQGRLVLDYQEVVPLSPEAKEGPHIELLLRLRDEDGQLVPPGTFLPAAERYGLMPAVDRWVIRTALSNFTRLHPSGEALSTCAINLSGATVDDEDIADFILGCLDEYSVPAEAVCLEITETVAVRSLLKVSRVIQRLRAAGCRIALDDFGAGMSSFGYLKNLPVDVIKIDGSFIREVDEDPMSRTIVSAIVQIGHQRGLKVVAEWVDDEAIRDVLWTLGVDYGQGFVLSMPQRVVFQRD